MKTHFVYIIKCSDGTLYTGWTTDPEKRLKAHNAGRGARYTRSRRPVQMVYREEWGSKSEALKREAAIKRLSRTEKLRLIAGGRTGDSWERERGEDCSSGSC